MRSVSTPKKYYFAALTTVILLALNFYSTKAMLVFGSPMLFALALLVEFVLLGIFLYNLARSLTTPGRVAKSLTISAWDGLKTNVYMKQIRESKSPFLPWTSRRFQVRNWYGLLLTFTILVASYFLVNFLNLLFAVTSKGSITQIDTRVLNLMPSIRTPLQTTFFRAVTTLANFQTTILLTIALVIVLWLKRHRVLAGMFIVAVTAEELITWIIKNSVQRHRPDQSLSIIREGGYSFPSGHVFRATLLFGLLAYLFFKSSNSKKAKFTGIVLFVLSVFLVAISRIYLGVHYPSDVWGSVLIGWALLALSIGGVEIVSRYESSDTDLLRVSKKTVPVISGLLVVFAISASPFLVPTHQVVITPPNLVLQAIDSNSVSRLPLYSETLTGSRMEPISFIYVGSENQLVGTFTAHGWYRADKSTVSNTLRAIAIGFQGRQYLTAPVTPSYLNFKPENIAFEQSTATHSLKQRHHTRIWRTDYVLPDGRQIWVATASFDEGVEFAGAAKLPTHHIDPNIDRERSYIITSLGLQGELLTVVQPQLGKNASGDSFFTDGIAELVHLK